MVKRDSKERSSKITKRSYYDEHGQLVEVEVPETEVESPQPEDPPPPPPLPRGNYQNSDSKRNSESKRDSS